MEGKLDVVYSTVEECTGFNGGPEHEFDTFEQLMEWIHQLDTEITSIELWWLNNSKIEIKQGAFPTYCPK